MSVDEASSQQADVLVVGGGPGGYVAAIRAAQLGNSVTLVEKSQLGGVCLNVGCIPSKALISAAEHYETVKESTYPGIQSVATLDYRKVQEWKNSVVRRFTDGVKTLLEGHSIHVVSGEAFFASGNEVRVMTEHKSDRYQFQKCILATGSRPSALKSVPFGKRVLSSTDVLSLCEVPRSMVIVGGGYIGIELGQTFAKFGTKITIVESLDSVLATFDHDLVKLIERNLKKYNVEIYTGAMAKSVQETDDHVTLTFTDRGGIKKSVTTEYVLLTVGRRPNTDNLGLEAAGVKLAENGLIKVNEQLLTTNPNVYAIGDIVPGPALAHKASYEGKIAAEALSGRSCTVDYRCIPTVVFSDPEISTVGLSVEAAKAQYGEIAVGRFPYAANGRAVTLHFGAGGYVKVIAEKASGMIVGAEIIGKEASNLISELALAIEMSATLEDVAFTIHAHPTLGEMVMEASEAAMGLSTHVLSH